MAGEGLEPRYRICCRKIRCREVDLLRANPRRVPIVAMTASAVEGDHERCLAAGMDDYLAKPIRIAHLARALERWAGDPRGDAGAGPVLLREKPVHVDDQVGQVAGEHIDGPVG